MKLLARFARLPLRIQILALGAAALIAAGVAVGRRPVSAPPPPHTSAPATGAIAPPSAGSRAPTAAFATRLPAEAMTDREAAQETPPIATSYRRDVVRPRPVDNSATRGADPADAVAPEGPPTASGGPANRRRDPKATRPEIFRMPGSPPAPAVGALIRTESDPALGRPTGGSRAEPRSRALGQGLPPPPARRPYPRWPPPLPPSAE